MQILPEEIILTHKNPIQLFYEGLTVDATRIEYIYKLKKEIDIRQIKILRRRKNNLRT